MESTERERLERAARHAAREVLAVAVGFAVLGVNKVQVERRKRRNAPRPTPTDRRPTA